MPTEPGIYWCRIDSSLPDWNGVARISGEAPFLRCEARTFLNFGMAAGLVTDCTLIDFGPRVEIPEAVISDSPIAA